jgi:FAD/FMN-containing dehydrogenase
MSIDTTVLDELRHIVGSSGYFDTPEDIAPFTVDHRKLYRGSTPLVLRPSNTKEVSAILRTCNDAGVGVVPVGGNTSYCGAATPSADNSQVVVSLARMRRVRSVDASNYTLIAEAGCVLAEVQTAAAEVGRLFPLSLGSEGSCQLGGNLSTNAGGTAVLRYGMMRDLVLGLEVVLADGRIWDGLSPLRKDNTGYDLRDLFIGAEGTLGIITAAACKLFSPPHEIVTAIVAVPDPQAAVTLLSRLRTTTGDAVTSFELIPRFGLELVCRHIERVSDPFQERHDWYVLLEVGTGRSDSGFRSSIEAELFAAMEAGEIQNAALAENEAQREMFWKLRETIPEAQRTEGASMKHDISVTTSDLPRFMREASALLAQLAPEARILAYGHLGDGNLHFNLSQPVAGDAVSFTALAPSINRAIHDLVASFGGSISAEHGIGQLKRAELARYKSPVALDVMRSIKNALDPKGVMNPGKVL